MQAGDVFDETGGTTDVMDVTRAQNLGRLGVTLKPDTPHFFVRRLFVATEPP